MVAKQAGFKTIGVYTFNQSFLEDGIGFSHEHLYDHLDEVLFLSDQYAATMQEAQTAEERSEIVDWVLNACGPLDGVVPASEPSIIFAAEMAQSSGLLGHSPNFHPSYRDKLLMRQTAYAAGIQQPFFAGVTNERELSMFSAEYPCPLVIKAPQSAGTQDVFLCSTPEELREKLKFILSSRDIFGHQSKYAIVETLIDGPEYAVNLFGDGHRVQATDVWSYRKVDNGVCWRSYRDIVLQSQDDPAIAEVCAFMENVCEHFDLLRGPVHGEVILSPEGPCLVEFGARLAGSSMADLMPVVSDFDPRVATIQAFTQSEAPMAVHVKRQGCAASVYGDADRKGTVKSIVGLQEIQKLPSYHSHKLTINPGDSISPSEGLVDLPLNVLLVTDSNEQLEADIDAVHEAFGILFTEEGA